MYQGVQGVYHRVYNGGYVQGVYHRVYNVGYPQGVPQGGIPQGVKEAASRCEAAPESRLLPVSLLVDTLRTMLWLSFLPFGLKVGTTGGERTSLGMVDPPYHPGICPPPTLCR